MRRLEKVVEHKFVNWIVNHHPGYKAFKLNPVGTNGLPDRLVVGPNRLILFIEFKRLGEEPEPLQQFYLDYLTECNHDVEVCWTIEEAKEIFYASVQALEVSD
jgi:hypothetical protein